MADRGEDVARARVPEHERVGQLHAFRQIGAGRRQHAGVFDQRLQPRLAFTRDRHLRAQQVARLPQLLLDLAAGRIQFRRGLQFQHAFFELAGAGEAAALREVIERRPLTRAFQRELRVQIVGALPHRLGVFDDGEVEVFEGFGFLAGAKGGGAGAGGRRDQRGGGEQAGGGAPSADA